MLKPTKEPLHRFKFFIILAAIWRMDWKRGKTGIRKIS